MAGATQDRPAAVAQLAEVRGFMTDMDKCSLIAKLEGFCDTTLDGELMVTVGERPNLKMYRVRDYAYDLNAMMRAARRLPDDIELVVHSGGFAVMEKQSGFQQNAVRHIIDDPARAAFEALASWLMERTK